MKLWLKSDEWTHYANCLESEDHTLPPERPDDGPTANVELVQEKCAACRVRPECIKWATDPDRPQGSIWCAGRWIPDDKRQARKVRKALVLTLVEERKLRGEDV